MKMILTVLSLAFLSANAQAADYGYKQKEYGYESSAGRKYQYDTNNAGDAIRYKNDYNAQQRDRANQQRSNAYKDILEESYGDKRRGAGVLDD